nr:hypothetical protein [uncultured Pedobacter sp.]
MLEIKLNGKTINTDSDIQIPITIENPLFIQERIPVPFSYSFDLPPTQNNLTLFNFPNRVNSVAKQTKFEQAEIIFDAIVFLTGSFIYLGFDIKIKVQFLGLLSTDFADKSLYQLPTERIDLGPATFNGGEPFITEDNRVEFRSFLDAMQPDLFGPFFSAAPIKIKDTKWPDINEDQKPVEDGGRAADIQYLNFFNAKFQKYATDGGGTESAIFPQPFVSKLLQSIFGNILINNLFATSGELYKLILLTNYHPSIPLGGAILMRDKTFEYDSSDGHFYFNVSSFLPDVNAVDILKDLLKVFGISVFPVLGKLIMKFNSEALTSSEKEDWTKFLTGKLAGEFGEIQNYSYGWPDLQDETNNDLGIEEELNFFAAQQKTTLTTEFERIYLTQNKQIIKKKLRSIDDINLTYAGRYIYEMEKNNLGSSDPKENVIDLKPKILRVLPVNLEQQWYRDSETPYIEMQEWAVPVWEGDRFTRGDKAYIMILQGKKYSGEELTNGYLYPYASNLNIDYLGNSTGNLSLRWDGEKGIIENYHQEYQNFLSKVKLKTSGVFLLDVRLLRNLDLSKKKNILGKDFFIEKLQFTISKDRISPSTVDLVEAVDVKISRLTLTINIDETSSTIITSKITASLSTILDVAVTVKFNFKYEHLDDGYFLEEHTGIIPALSDTAEISSIDKPKGRIVNIYIEFLSVTPNPANRIDVIYTPT